MKKIITTLLVSGMVTAFAATPVLASALPSSNGSLSLGSGIKPGITKEAVSDESRIALDDVGISIVADDYTAISQDDGFVYIYTMEEDNYPYVIMGRYDFEDENFADLFTEYMSGVYSDLDVDSLQEGVKVGNYKFDIIKYDYSVGSSDIDDTRMFIGIDGYTYMFGSKEVDETNLELPDDYLKYIASHFEVMDDASSFTEHVNEKDSLYGNGMSGMNDDKYDDKYDDRYDDVDDIDDINDIDDIDDIDDINDIDDFDFDDDDFDDDDDTIHFTTDMAPFSGTWVEFEDGFKLYFPFDWLEYIPEPEQQEAGCFYQAGDKTAQTNQKAPYIFVNFGSTDGASSLPALAQVIEKEGYDIEGLIYVNDIPCIAYSYEEYNIIGLAFIHPDDDNFVFTIVAYNYSYNPEMLSAILCSLTPRS